MTKIDEHSVVKQNIETGVEAPRSFRYQYQLARQNYEEILENLVPIILYGNMSVEEIECFMRNYENPYIEKCKNHASEEQSMQIEELQMEMYYRLNRLLILHHPVLKQVFMEQLAIYGYQQKGNIFAYFICHEQEGSFQYINKAEKEFMLETYEVDKQGRITKPKKQPMVKLNLESSGKFHFRRRTSLFHHRYSYYLIKDVDIALWKQKMILHSFCLEHQENKTELRFTNRIFLKKVENEKGNTFTFDPYSYTQVDDMSQIIKRSIAIWKQNRNK